MSNYAIRAESLGKRYRIGVATRRRTTLFETLTDAALTPIRNFQHLRRQTSFDRVEEPDAIWALRDIDFEVKHGEAFGLIGRNGAGKSTLLKILSRITRPTTGRARVRGRVGSLLEVGTGFHPELSGRDNIFLNGSILGMDRAYIARHFDEIVEFSGLDTFLDTPVKRYSTGMYMRLAFAVAAHLDPEIMIVDEVLAVGDAAFQKKCLRKMGDVAGSGRTILFVSHNMPAVQSLCERSMLLHQGKLVDSGPTDQIIKRYLDTNNGLYSPVTWAGVYDSGGDVRVAGVRVSQNGHPTGVAHCQSPTMVEIEYEIVRAVPNARFFLTLRNERGEIIFTTCDYDVPTEEALDKREGRYLSSVTIPAGWLKTGTVYGTFGADVKAEGIVFAVDDLVEFDVVDSGFDLALSERHFRSGVVAPLLPWRTSPLGDSPSGNQAPSSFPEMRR